MYNLEVEAVDHLDEGAHVARELRNDVTEEQERSNVALRTTGNARAFEKTAHNLCERKRSVCVCACVQLWEVALVPG